MKYFRVIKVLRAEEVRQVCIDYRYYTAGNCREYDNMFSMLNDLKDISDDVLENVAEDILAHSRTDDTLWDVMTHLANRIECCIIPR